MITISINKDQYNFITVVKNNGDVPSIDGMGNMEEFEDILLKHMCEISDEIGEG